MHKLNADFDMLQVRFDNDTQAGPSINVFGYLGSDQAELIESIDLGPFPDWAAIAQRLMRDIIQAGRRSLG